jgi:hypothetical protein
MPGENVEQEIAQRGHIVGSGFVAGGRVYGVTPQLDLVSHRHNVARINRGVNQALRMKVVQGGQDSPKNFECVRRRKGCLVKSRLESLVGALKYGEKNGFAVGLGPPGIKKGKQVRMSKAGRATPQSHLEIGCGRASGNESEYRGAGVRTIRGTEQGGVFGLSQALLKEIPACENDALQALPSRSHAVSKRVSPGTASTPSTLIMIGTVGKMVRIKVT